MSTPMQPYAIDLTAIHSRIGQELVVSPWVSISQRKIDAFAEAIDDRQRIFVDPLRAAAESPFETTIAHGFLVLSLISSMLSQSLEIRGMRMAINYGLDRVRFMAPVHAGATIRTRFTVGDVQERPDHVRVTWKVVVERQHEDKPCCVADWVTRYYKQA